MTKYHAKPTVVEGIRFASQKEARRYTELRLLESAGAITGLRLQVRYPLHTVTPSGELAKVCVYVADYVYTENGATVVEDCKGVVTQAYATKRKWMLLEYGIAIRET
jgi:hypothetical protein